MTRSPSSLKTLDTPTDADVAEVARQGAMCCLPTCDLPAQDAVSINCCGAVFCQTCLVENMTAQANMSASSQALCPVCKSPHVDTSSKNRRRPTTSLQTGGSYYSQARHIRQLVAKMTVPCRLCAEVVAGDMLHHHLREECWEAVVECPAGGALTRDDLVVVGKKTAGAEKSCQWSGLRKEFSVHLETCESGHRKQLELK